MKAKSNEQTTSPQKKSNRSATEAHTQHNNKPENKQKLENIANKENKNKQGQNMEAPREAKKKTLGKHMQKHKPEATKKAKTRSRPLDHQATHKNRSNCTQNTRRKGSRREAEEKKNNTVLETQHKNKNQHKKQENTPPHTTTTPTLIKHDKWRTGEQGTMFMHVTFHDGFTQKLTCSTSQDHIRESEISSVFVRWKNLIVLQKNVRTRTILYLFHLLTQIRNYALYFWAHG